jgi:excisionase family DNA binding protein
VTRSRRNPAAVDAAAPRRRFGTVRQAAELLGYTERQVHRWIAAGELPVHRFGRSIRISEENLEASSRRRAGAGARSEIRGCPRLSRRVMKSQQLTFSSPIPQLFDDLL